VATRPDAARHVVDWDPSVPAITEWVAILAVAPAAEALDHVAVRLLRRVPDHVLLGRVDAHHGLAEQLDVPPGTWVGGVAAPSRAELERALTQAGGTLMPLVVGEFRVRRLAG
jgi:hypothetical protein